jgi:hypothetical protein
MILFRRVFGKVHFIGFAFPPDGFYALIRTMGPKSPPPESKQKAPALSALEGKQ